MTKAKNSFRYGVTLILKDWNTKKYLFTKKTNAKNFLKESIDEIQEGYVIDLWEDKTVDYYPN